MRILLVSCVLIASLLRVDAASEIDGGDGGDEKPEITKLELIELPEADNDGGPAKDSAKDVQRKRDSGYAYRRPESFAAAAGGRFHVGHSGHRGRIVNRHPGQISRPITKYGPPGYQNSSPGRPAGHGERHRDKLQFHAHSSQQQQLQEQEIPSPIRQADFVEPNPISTQNTQPFATHSANYLPPQNQKLPGYSVAQSFQAAQPDQGQRQSIVQPQPQSQISDAALFLAQNAHAIQQLYGSPANEQEFAPEPDRFADPLANRLENFESGSRRPEPQGFPGPLPSYASGTLSPRESLEQIQSLEKDRLIVQLQRALATQSRAREQSADAIGGSAATQPSFVPNQDLLASLGQRPKIPGSDARPSTTLTYDAFDRSPFLPGTTLAPVFPFSYGTSSTVQPPTTSTATTTTTTTPTTSTVLPPQGAKGDGSSQVGSSVPAPPLPSPGSGVPIYGGFVPTLIAGTSFLSNAPSYGPSFFAPPPVGPAQTSGSSPTHFGLPIPTDPSQKPSFAGGPPSTAASTPTPPTFSSTSKPTVIPVHPVVTPLHPVTPLQPVLPAAPANLHPVQTAHPPYGLQTPLIDSLLYKPVKPVYPFYYYPNVAYQLHKPTVSSPTYPWSYAPTYAQPKPTQIWK